MESQSVIKLGIACRVGLGSTTINVLKDPWLPDMQNPYILSNNIALEGAIVSSLFVTGDNRWDVDMLYDLFDEREVNLILSIPVNQFDNDVWYWRKERLGQYSVKSAYLLIQQQKNIQTNEVLSRSWKRLWALKIPPKVKHLMWRAVTGCLLQSHSCDKSMLMLMSSVLCGN